MKESFHKVGLLSFFLSIIEAFHVKVGFVKYSNLLFKKQIHSMNNEKTQNIKPIHKYFLEHLN